MPRGRENYVRSEHRSVADVDMRIVNQRQIEVRVHVLAEVRKEDYPLFAEACKKAGEAAAEFARGLDIEKVMCKYN